MGCQNSKSKVGIYEENLDNLDNKLLSSQSSQTHLTISTATACLDSTGQPSTDNSSKDGEKNIIPKKRRFSAPNFTAFIGTPNNSTKDHPVAQPKKLKRNSIADLRSVPLSKYKLQENQEKDLFGVKKRPLASSFSINNETPNLTEKVKGQRNTGFLNNSFKKLGSFKIRGGSGSFKSSFRNMSGKSLNINSAEMNKILSQALSGGSHIVKSKHKKKK